MDPAPICHMYTACRQLTMDEFELGDDESGGGRAYKIEGIRNATMVIRTIGVITMTSRRNNFFSLLLSFAKAAFLLSSFSPAIFLPIFTHSHSF